MTTNYLRLVFLSEFLVAVVAVFTGWSEIGGQAVLDVMPWGWKCGLGLGLAIAFVAYTAAVVSNDSPWNLRAARWLGLIVVLLLGMGMVTYYYSLQTQNQNGESGEDPDNPVSSLQSNTFRLTLPNV
jgi:hypothetical protein